MKSVWSAVKICLQTSKTSWQPPLSCRHLQFYDVYSTCSGRQQEQPLSILNLLVAGSCSLSCALAARSLDGHLFSHHQSLQMAVAGIQVFMFFPIAFSESVYIVFDQWIFILS